MSVNEAQTRVAIMTASDQDQGHLSNLLGEAGLNVVMQHAAGEDFLRLLDQTTADILLVDMSDECCSQVDIIDALLEINSIPVIFNDSSKEGGGTDSVWAKKLARKLQMLAQENLAENALTENAQQQENILTDVVDVARGEERATAGLKLETVAEAETIVNYEMEQEARPSESSVTVLDTKSRPVETATDNDAGKNIWVLGASLGGPQAVRQFLMTIKEDLPVAFILAQHIGENHISLLAEQLNRISKFKVFPGYSGHRIRHKEVILAPAGKQLRVTQDGYIALSEQPADAIYSPCINDVMKTVAERYGNMSGTIIFSGMGDDGALGCQSIAENGGIVWAQDVESCVISSMPDQARKTNNVTFSANPRRLADELYKYYMG
jgi:chemosensory pili system protein ChpB (putative protein-glutamate methylesterase)